ncbi:MAG TPA: M56 family metallopeptidase, partial [Chitinophagaceae bacterium]
MHLPFMQQDTIIQALGWTFVHSLWQGMLLAVLAGLIILLTRKSGAKLRYTLLLSLFCLFLAATVFTFINQLNKGTVIAGAQPLAAAAQDKVSGEYDLFSPVIDSEVKEVNNRFTDRFVQYFNTHAPMIVLIWFIVFSARMVKLLANLGYVQRIRYQKTHNPTAHWKRRMQQMADGLLIRQKLQLLESEIVNVPVVVGFFKPIILIPLGLLTHLPPAQVEAILLHELAHIKRRDYFVNLLQSFAETIFFFNPAVLWLSSLIREERENCCDDIAVAGSGNKTAFLDALVSFQEYTHRPAGYGMAFPGRKNHLLNRVKRILHQKNKTLNTMEKSLLTISIAFILLLMLSTVRQVQGQNDTPATAAKVLLPPPPAPAVKPGSPVVTIDIAPLPPVRQSVHANRAPVPPKASSEPQAAPVPPVPPVTSEPSAAPVPPPVMVGPAQVRIAPVSPMAAPTPPVLLRDTAPAENLFPHLSCNINDDGANKTETLEATDRAGVTYKVNKLNDVITSLSVNGIEVPKEQYDKYKPVIDQIEQQRLE